MKDHSSMPPDPRHETRDANVRGVAWFAIGLLVMLAVIFIAIRGLSGVYRHQQPVATTPRRAALLPPEPQLQSDPAADLARFREHENAALNSYGWVDRSAGVVRIPIEQAMDLIAERGLPAPQFSSGKTPLQLRQERAGAERIKP